MPAKIGTASVYVCVIILTHRRNPWGYGAGCFVAAFWNWINLVHTTFIANGVRELMRAMRTGEIRRPNQLIAVCDAAAHFALIALRCVGPVVVPT